MQSSEFLDKARSHPVKLTIRISAYKLIAEFFRLFQRRVSTILINQKSMGNDVNFVGLFLSDCNGSRNDSMYQVIIAFTPQTCSSESQIPLSSYQT